MTMTVRGHRASLEHPGGELDMTMLTGSIREAQQPRVSGTRPCLAGYGHAWTKVIQTIERRQGLRSPAWVQIRPLVERAPLIKSGDRAYLMSGADGAK